MNAVKLLYLPLLLVSHTTLTGTFTNILLLLLHDFIQHTIQRSHRWYGILGDILERRYILSATLGAQLYYMNMALLQAALFTGVALTEGDLAVLLQAVLNGRKVDGVGIAAVFLATLPECVVNVVGYWIAAIGHTGLSVRARNGGCEIERVCVDDVIIGAGTSIAGLRFGVRVVRMVVQASYSRIVPAMRQGTTCFQWGIILGEMFDMVGFVSCQTLLAGGVAAEKVLGKSGMIRRGVVKTLGVEIVMRLVRVGMGAWWGWWGFDIGIVVIANLVLMKAMLHAWEVVEELKEIEKRREQFRECS